MTNKVPEKAKRIVTKVNIKYARKIITGIYTLLTAGKWRWTAIQRIKKGSYTLVNTRLNKVITTTQGRHKEIEATGMTVSS
jgi:hypothetical protein